MTGLRGARRRGRRGPRFDERLWYIGRCGERDYLLDGHGHTFPGRMSAWCPKGDHAHDVSEVGDGGDGGDGGDVSRGAVLRPGIPHLQRAGPFLDEEFDTPEDDWLAWRAALAQFHRTGCWAIGWATCESCGRVLLPGSARRTCESHTEQQ